MHSSHLLAELLPGDRLQGQEALSSPRKVTLHDPCYLGRHNQDYETVRGILAQLPGIQVVEMKRNRADSLCCGGGGGNFFTGLASSGPETSAQVRAKEAVETGAEVLITSCPICTIMLEDAVKSLNLDSLIQVREISELIHEQFFQD